MTSPTTEDKSNSAEMQSLLQRKVDKIELNELLNQKVNQKENDNTFKKLDVL